ncbi:MAG: hypothetical protein ABI234_00210 [Ktedonobacteraceae bacterium]
MRQIGQIKQVQIQRTALKQGQKPQRYYDPAPILVVEKLLLTPRGVLGVTVAGEQLVDVHNADHPASRYASVNGISLGFTSHYQAMREKFGAHLTDGCAGENILVEIAEAFQLEALGERIAIQSQESSQWVYLERLRVAAPCVEFSYFALNELLPVPAEILRETLMFLDQGQRGFYATFMSEEPLTLQAGDTVFVEA